MPPSDWSLRPTSKRRSVEPLFSLALSTRASGRRRLGPRPGESGCNQRGPVPRGPRNGRMKTFEYLILRSGAGETATSPTASLVMVSVETFAAKFSSSGSVLPDFSPRVAG